MSSETHGILRAKLMSQDGNEHLISTVLKFTSVKLLSAIVSIIVAIVTSQTFALNVYQTSFDSLSLGHTQPFPGSIGQDGWFKQAGDGTAYGEIENAISNSGGALHEFAPQTNPAGDQTIDQRSLEPLDVTLADNITLTVQFFAHTNNLSGTNAYDANFGVRGGPHPGFEIIAFGLGGGHFTPKSVTGVNVAASFFNGADNDQPLPLSVGQNLAWDSWHTLSLSINQLADRYISITVAGQSQDLSAYQPPRSFIDSLALRGQLIENISGQIVPS